jgi:hypothetical protein
MDAVRGDKLSRVKGRELERLLELVEEVERARAAVRRAEALADEIAHDDEIAQRAPAVARAAAERSARIAAIARELERQWVEQSPLVAAWEQAVELRQEAESTGTDAAPFEVDVVAARRGVESARLATRDQQARLVAEREALADAVLAAPFDVPLPEPVGDDDRPEAVRRDALALIELAGHVQREAGRALAAAAARLVEARRELDGLGPPEELRTTLGALERRLPEAVALPERTPPSVGLRLERAGLRVVAS